MSVIFWDFDGTLVYSRSHWTRAGLDALNGAETDADAFDRLLHRKGMGFPWNCPDDDHTRHTGEGFWEYFCGWYARCFAEAGVPEETAVSAAGNVPGLLADHRNYTLYPDTLSTLAQTREMGHKNVLLSNNYPELPCVMEKLGILGLFDGLVISGIEGWNKPRRELFDIAKSRFPSENYYMVGDNPVADMLGAKNAGMTAILVHAGASENADHCFGDLASVIELVRK